MGRSRIVPIGLAALALALLPGAPALAQVGGISVRVLDAADGSPLPGAGVTLSNAQGLIAPTTRIAGPSGEVHFPVLRAGSAYLVRVAMPGFATHQLTDLRVRSDVTERYDVMLSPEMQERVEVSARRATVELDSQGSTSKFDDAFIENLPVPGRFYQNILSLAPGVNDWDGDGNPNVHGARTREFRGVVGGVSNTDPLTGEWLSYVNPASIEEMEIIAAGAGVEFGRASGGFARIVQRQGSNEFEGLFSFLWRSSRLDGDSGADFGSQEAKQYDWYQPAIQVSGPIVKDKLWYRLSHEYIDQQEPVDFIDRVELVERDQRIIADQITWQASPRNKLAFQYQDDPVTVTNYGLDSRVSAESTQTLEQGGPTYSLTWIAPVSPTLLVDSVVAYQDHRRTLTPTTRLRPNGCAQFEFFDVLNTARCVDSDFASITGSHYESSDDRRQRLTVRSQATLFAGRFLGMSHRFKLGLEVENERYFRQLDRGPDLLYYSVTNPLGPDTGVVTAQTSAPRVGAGSATGVSLALYAEDQFRPRDNLTITLGLRVDREEIDSKGQAPFDSEAETEAFYNALDSGLTVVQAAPAIFTAYANVEALQDDLARVLGVGQQQVPLGSTAQQSTFWLHKRITDDIQIRNTNFSPRFSLAWDPWGDGKSKLAISAGRYYDKIFLAVPLLEVEPPKVNLVFETFPVGEQGDQVAFEPFEGIAATVSTQMVDRDLRTPYQDEFTLSFERMLWPETSLRVSYIKRDYQDQLQDVDVNHRYGDEGRCLYKPVLGRPVVAASEGEGFELTDPYTGERYTDTDPGPGDGIIDDCMGDIVRVGGLLGRNEERPDGKRDLYVLNPGWGEILLVGNFNTTQYEAFVIELVRRQYRNWQMNASYTWSEAIGDAEDFAEIQGNERNLLEDERGYLSFDQRHMFKFSGISITPWGFRVGGTVRWESGLPYSTLESRLTAYNVPLGYLGIGDRDLRTRLRYPTGQRNDQRNPSFWTVDLRLAKEFRLQRRVQLQLTAEVFNLLDDQSLRLEGVINGTATGVRRFGRSFQLGMRLSF